ncbi:MAG: response regulator, partial [Lachnospiraceae bacterium]|nr:response regulator [Lachnospiraceae bacterium]
NLVDNAIKFTNEGGVIIRINTRKENYGVNLCISVKDTGIGITEESLEKLFESFSQVDTRRNRQEGGVGLGLAISKALVQKMGGTITVKSRPGKGSTFRFVVPQKVLDEKPIGAVENREKLNIAAYFDMEQFDMMTIRDEYSALIANMVRKLRVRCHACRNLAELMRREANEAFTHIFISLEEYQEDEAYFDALAKTTQVIIVIDRPREKYLSNPNFIRLYKPFYVLPVVSILNGSRSAEGGKQMVRPGKFTAPDAHILVVDDNRMNIRVVEGLLKEYQIKVTYATSGQEALQIIENMSYDFVFMDHMMPEMDGVETLHRIREKVGHYYQKVPIIALTANAAPGNREMFLEEGFDDFVSKPLEVSVLERVLRRNLPEDKLIFQGKKEVQETKESKEDAFAVGDLEVENGILYCGGKEEYLQILEAFYEEKEECSGNLSELFEKQDWTNYTIKVHALKSMMQNIGALPLSAKAKALEMAGKKNDIDYIMKNHEDMLTEYWRVMRELEESPLVHTETAESDTSELKEALDMPELSESDFDEMFTKFEDAAYTLDGENMLAVLSELQKYQYHQVSLEQKLASVKKKVEMSDYMSALDSLTHIREELKKETEGGADRS